MTSSAIPRTHIARLGGFLVAWTMCGLGAWAVGRSAGLSEIFPLKVAIIFGTVVVIVAQSADRHHPFDRFGPANIVTTFRAAFVSGAIALVGDASAAEVTTAIASVTLMILVLDGVDGWLARRTGLASDFGARFDMEIDALLILALSLLAWQLGKAGAWIILGGALRYLFVAAGWRFTWLTTPLPASFRRKAVCVIQIAGMTAILLPGVVPPVSTGIAAALLVALSISFGIDVFWAWRHSA